MWKQNIYTFIFHMLCSTYYWHMCKTVIKRTRLCGQVSYVLDVFRCIQKALSLYGCIQGPLITYGRNSCEWTYHCVGLSKFFIMIKISGQKSEKYFQMERSGIVYHICKSCIQPLEKSYICTFFRDKSSTKLDCNM